LPISSHLTHLFFLFFQNESVLTFAIEARGPGERQHIDLRFILIFLPKGIG